MNFSAPFVLRPVATTLITIAVALAGTLAYFMLPVSPLPQVDFPTIEVQASLPGGSPETLASSVATPLERQLSHIAGITEMTSISSLSSTELAIQFDLSKNIDAAAREVQAAINAARGQRPASLPQNPKYQKVNPADQPIVMLSLTSDIFDRGRMFDVASSVLQQKLSQVPGVGQVNLGGGALPAVRVNVNPVLLNQLGLSLEDVRAALAAANANRPKGSIASPRRSWELASTDQLFRAAEYRKLVLVYQGGAAVRLGDVARVSDSVEDTRTAGLVDAKPAINITIFRQPNANIIETADRVLSLLPLMQAQIPPGMKLGVVMDRTVTIRASVRDVEGTLLLSIALVILVVFAFLRNVRATLIPAVVVPISLLGTFGVMYLAGYSLDNLSLMALTIATGFVVDDAIVVIENISRHLELGRKPLEAALDGAREIGLTVVTISVSLIAVFIPILMMQGIVGRLFREFAVVLSVAIAVSLVISMTTTPMMCAYLLRPEHEQRHGALYQWSERVLELVVAAYRYLLRRVLDHQTLTLVVTLATIALTVRLYAVVPKGFFPQQDTGRLSGAIIGDQDTSSQSMRVMLDRFCETVMADPAVDHLGAFLSGTGGKAANSGRMFVALKDIGERQLTADRVISRLRKALGKIPGATLYLQSMQDLKVGGLVSGGQYQFTLQGDDLDELAQWAPRMRAKIETLPGLVDVSSDQQDRGLLFDLVVDRDTAARLGVSLKSIDDTLYDAFGQRQVSTMYTELNQYHVVMEVMSQFGQNPDGLRSIYVKSDAGKLIPISALASYRPHTGLLTVSHKGLFPSVTISFNLRPGFPLGTAVDEIRESEREIMLPATIHGTFSGTAQAFQDSLASEPPLILASLFAVYIVLGMLYESVIHPVTILSTIPSAGVGALVALLICKAELSVIALIGILLLIGIVKKNAIMMIDFALEAERAQGLPPEEAIFEACVLRFRPITMTTMAALFGALPMALSSGIGSELRQPLGITIVGGLIVSQALTLFTTPVVYLFLDRLRRRFGPPTRGMS